MTPDPTLTDEELALLEREAERGLSVTSTAGLRLIAALRASRAEVELWQRNAEAVGDALFQVRAEVERLRGPLTCGEVHPTQDVYHPGGHPRHLP